MKAVLHDHRGGSLRTNTARIVWTGLAGIVTAGLVHAPTWGAVTPESPEVQRLVGKAIAYLEKNQDQRFGGICLNGLVFLKSNRPEHARVKEALAACQKTIQDNPSDVHLDMYSNGLAIIFLCELSPEKYKREIEWFLARMKARQKAHGGWGYSYAPTGDTSQTQYAALSYWEANRRGFRIDGASVENLADWLMKSQDPSGCWGYQGNVSPDGKLVQQNDMNCSMLAAGLGSLYICADLMDMGKEMATASQPAEEVSPLPAALRPASVVGDGTGTSKIRPQRTDSASLQGTMARAHQWMKENYLIDIGSKKYYYLYGLERYKSFQEAFDHTAEESPKWYNDGYESLAREQQEDGSWRGYCGTECDTAFSVLFLLRSTQKAIRAKLGEGTLLSGRGLPTNLARAKMRNGQLIVEQVHTKVDELLSMIDEDDEALLDELARDPGQLVVERVDKQSARRLQQLVQGGEPEVRLLAVRALGRSGELDYVPTLLYALTDPDKQVVLEARNGLCFISRNFEGLGPPDEFTDAQRYQAIDSWRQWYLTIRPDAILPSFVESSIGTEP
jgi:hypothetical protein